MKIQGLFLIVAALFGSLPAFAGPARCGDFRTITRTAGTEGEATQAAVDRLSKFDNECSALGGNAILTDSSSHEWNCHEESDAGATVCYSLVSLTHECRCPGV